MVSDEDLLRLSVRTGRHLLGEVETVAVKEGVSSMAAVCLHPEVARKMIREAAQAVHWWTGALAVAAPALMVAPVMVCVISGVLLTLAMRA